MKPVHDPLLPKARWLLVINHHEARIFRSDVHGTAAELIRPNQSDESIRHRQSFDGFSRGLEKPAANSYFGPVAEALKGAEQLLLFGSGTGSSNEMDQFIAWLAIHRPELSHRITGALVIDAHHITDAELLAKARDYYAPAEFLKNLITEPSTPKHTCSTNSP
jgi:hypothetical protein